MKGKIVLEEAVTLPQLAYQAAFHAPQGREDELVADLLDIHNQRLRRMDDYGVQYMILSITSPGAQGFGDKTEAEAFATEANDYLSKEAAKNPKRFGALCVKRHSPVADSRPYQCMTQSKLQPNSKEQSRN
jgi:predicted TIM-barrel fold metal-dependent hydrolase